MNLDKCLLISIEASLVMMKTSNVEAYKALNWLAFCPTGVLEDDIHELF